jgi:hypothetical protein
VKWEGGFGGISTSANMERRLGIDSGSSDGKWIRYIF